MSQTTTRQEQEKLIPTPQVLSAWAIELGRLASSVEQEIATHNFTPSVVSSLTAIGPIVQLLSDSLFTVVMNEMEWPDSTTEIQSCEPDFTMPGYL